MLYMLQKESSLLNYTHFTLNERLDYEKTCTVLEEVDTKLSQDSHLLSDQERLAMNKDIDHLSELFK